MLRAAFVVAVSGRHVVVAAAVAGRHGVAETGRRVVAAPDKRAQGAQDVSI